MHTSFLWIKPGADRIYCRPQVEHFFVYDQDGSFASLEAEAPFVRYHPRFGSDFGACAAEGAKLFELTAFHHCLVTAFGRPAVVYVPRVRI